MTRAGEAFGPRDVPGLLHPPAMLALDAQPQPEELSEVFRFPAVPYLEQRRRVELVRVFAEQQVAAWQQGLLRPLVWVSGEEPPGPRHHRWHQQPGLGWKVELVVRQWPPQGVSSALLSLVH